MKRVNKKGIELVISQLVYVLIFILVVVTVLVIYGILTGKGLGAIEFFKNMLRFRR